LLGSRKGFWGFYWGFARDTPGRGPGYQVGLGGPAMVPWFGLGGLGRIRVGLPAHGRGVVLLSALGRDLLFGGREDDRLQYSWGLFMGRIGFFVFLVGCLGAQAAVVDSDHFTTIPLDSVIQTKAVNFKPRATSVEVGTVADDADGDGVADSVDWCEKTPAGVEVWTAEKVKEKAQDAALVGCAGVAEENWLKKTTKMPRGRSVSCYLTALPSLKDRNLAAGVKLTVIDPDSSTVSDKERAKIARHQTDWYPEAVFGPSLLLETPGGNHLGFYCSATIQSLTKNEKGTGYDTTYTGDYASAPRVSDVKKIVTLAIAAPVEISLAD
jgi:hypothetical protein